MDTIFFSKARAELAGLLDKVNDDAAPVEIVRRDKPSAVLMGKDEYESLVETIHLLSSPANAARLLNAKKDLESGNLAERPAPVEIGR
ncbi:type II toxin-antitoxin system prevent-host-death family antitoxin [Ciceribacter sp. L1K22]|uniref:type II toxin-antitoxin system Phd/YefM family antitoxin n=1 Tax=Ciceribacter sp. L1K22 TaxID=2820275 RepID=UPI001ABEA9D1|nr:type II toxin-antitoxin system prevent-host-death family antitoxin [Ciceribacter sp. L1K22]MBO3761156.1 type II toxin-antitoxin system prevent-host-death family antitoxin [Ciceribacter sp. L1K22]